MKKENKVLQKFTGRVVKNKMQKTVVARVERTKQHPKYKKQYLVSRNYKVHDERGLCKIGDMVTFVSCRPLSKEKRWRILYSKEIEKNK